MICTEKRFFHLCGDLLQEKSPSPLFFLIGANHVCFGSERHIAPFVQTTGTQDIVSHDQCFWAQKAEARYDNLFVEVNEKMLMSKGQY